MDLISCCMLSYNRVENVQRIVETYRGYGLFDEFIIWHGNPDVHLMAIPGATIIRVSEARPKSVHDRFMAAAAARNDVVFFNDDDIISPKDALEDLINSYWEKPDVIHGLLAMDPDPDGLLKCLHARAETFCPILFTALVKRAHCIEYLQRMNEYIGWEGSQHAEDIIFAHQVYTKTGKMHRATGGRFSSMLFAEAPFALSKDPQFLDHRNAIFRRLYHAESCA